MGSPDFHYNRLMQDFIAFTESDTKVKELGELKYDVKTKMYNIQPVLEAEIKKNINKLSPNTSAFYAGMVVNNYLQDIDENNDALNACCLSINYFMDLLGIREDE